MAVDGVARRTDDLDGRAEAGVDLGEPDGGQRRPERRVGHDDAESIVIVTVLAAVVGSMSTR